MKRQGVECILGILLFISGCAVPDQKTIIGKWQSDRDWFIFKEDGTYDSGKDDIKMVHGFRYSLDKEKKELNIYTRDQNSTFYLRYHFFGNDTLGVRNVMSSDTQWVKFVRLKEE
ncbi:MAG TPA: hypothetical protein PLP34_10035 [Chitinophagaceae bacterium]|nr:hypothetical protein [Chitinophagaceae bacterium]HNF72745.1 hypothetical protein [Chitinophagaceae bacterium]